MSTITIADLPRISNEELHTKLTTASASPESSDLSSNLPSSIAIIDVRDSDHIGGHIKGSTWVPSKELDFRLPELVRTLQDKGEVIFHCALSQQRGPSAALRYVRARAEKGAGDGGKEGEGGQKVLILRGGFSEWQEKYGDDKSVTDDYDKNLWEYGGP